MATYYALVEYCIILYLTKTFKAEKKTKTNVLIETEEGQEKTETSSHVPKKNRRLILANIIEKFSKFLLPFYNIAFPICYFMVCTLAAP